LLVQRMSWVALAVSSIHNLSFLLRSRYSFILKEQSCCVICGYVPLCSTQRVLLWFNYAVGSPARVSRCKRCCVQTSTLNFWTETFPTVVSLFLTWF
jgi:hypothetical protein